MRTFVVILVLFTSLLGCNEKPAASNEPTASAPTADVTTTVLAVEGLSCSACVATIRKGVGALDGVLEVEVSLETGEARVRHEEGRPSPEQIASTIDELGFQATLR